MTTLVALYPDEDMSALVATLFRYSSGIIVMPQKNAYEVAQRIGILVSALTTDEIANQFLYA